MTLHLHTPPFHKMLPYFFVIAVLFANGVSVAYAGNVSLDMEVPIPGLPQSLTLCSVGEKELVCNGMAIYIVKVYTWVIGLAAFLALAAFTYAGIRWLTAGGESKNVEEAKKILTNSIVGLLLTLGSYTLLYLINPALTKPEAFKLVNIQKKEAPVAVAAPSTASNCKEKCGDKYCGVNERCENGMCIGGGVALSSRTGACCYIMADGSKKAIPSSLAQCKERLAGLGSTIMTEPKFYCAHTATGGTHTDAELCWEQALVTANQKKAGICQESADLSVIEFNKCATGDQFMAEKNAGHHIKYTPITTGTGPHCGKTAMDAGAWDAGVMQTSIEYTGGDGALVKNGAIDPELLGAIVSIAQECKDVTIAAFNEQCGHAAGSAHYAGRAVDIETFCGAIATACNQKQKDIIAKLNQLGYATGMFGKKCGVQNDDPGDGHLHIEVGGGASTSSSSSSPAVRKNSSVVRGAKTAAFTESYRI